MSRADPSHYCAVCIGPGGASSENATDQAQVLATAPAARGRSVVPMCSPVFHRVAASAPPPRWRDRFWKPEVSARSRRSRVPMVCSRRRTAWRVSAWSGSRFWSRS